MYLLINVASVFFGEQSLKVLCAGAWGRQNVIHNCRVIRQALQDRSNPLGRGILRRTGGCDVGNLPRPACTVLLHELG